MTERPEPDAGRTAEEVLRERGEASAPPAPKPKPGHGGARPGAGRKPTKKTKGKPETPVEEPISDEEVATYALLSGTIWDTAARVFKFDTLTKEESYRLGRALAPVVRKYAPAMDEWLPEFNLAVCLIGLASEKRVFGKKEKKDEDQLQIPGIGDDLDGGRAPGHP